MIDISARIVYNLIHNLERSQDPNQDLDWDIADVLGMIPPHKITESGWSGGEWCRKPDWRYLQKPEDSEYYIVNKWYPPKFTTSLDVIVEIIHELLPGWTWEISKDGRAIIHKRELGKLGNVYYCRSARNPAVGLCITTIKAINKIEW